MAKKKEVKKITLKDYADNHNPRLTRRQCKMSEGYLYRLIRQDIEGTNTTDLWFKYVLEGEKKHIYIEL